MEVRNRFNGLDIIDRVLEELYKKELNEPDNHSGVITHLEPDILECEVKWALGSMTTNKARGKEYIKAVYCHLAYLTYMQSIS